MKKIVSLLFYATLVVAVLFLVQGQACACMISSSYAAFTVKKAPAAKKTAEVTFKTKLHCANCVKKVVENISFIKGVKDLEVSLDNQEIRIVYDIKKTDVRTLADEIKKLGYPAVVKSESDK